MIRSISATLLAPCVGLITLSLPALGWTSPNAPDLRPRACLPALNYTVEISYDACYNDPTTPRTLSGASFTSSLNSPEHCGDLCGRSGFSYAGVEYSSQCFCGNSIANSQANETSCSTPCPGNATETCGGKYLINVWKVLNPIAGGEVKYFPDCTRDPLCSNDVCDTSLPAEQRAAGLVSAMTITEKLFNLVEQAPGVPRLGIQPYEWWSEGLHGLASSPGVVFGDSSGNFSYATSFPQPIILGAAFDDELVQAVAEVISTETRAFDNVGRVGLDLYTPNINAFRDPRWGRGQETPGEDPYHLQQYVAALLSGLEDSSTGQKKVIATCKHYAGNDFENYGSVTRHNFDAKITLQDLSEFYLPPFKTCAAEKQVGSFMCSYNAVNGIPSCANSYLLETILRKHWGWEKPEHYVSTDCGAIDDISGGHKYSPDLGHAAAVAMFAGTDLECSFGDPTALQDAWNQSLVAEKDVDKALTRLYTALVTAGFFDPATSQPLRSLGWTDVNTPAAQNLAYEAAVEGAVLLKNNGILPLQLNSSGSIAIIGPWAKATKQMQGNYYGPAPFLISPLQAAQKLGLNVTYVLGSAINTEDSSRTAAVEAASAADTIIYMGGIDTSIEAESLDRLNVSWPVPQINLIKQLATLGKPLVVVQFGGGQLDDTELLANDHVDAILWGGYPGQAGGTAILDLLVGKVAPSGRLPVTQYPANYTSSVPPTDMNLRPAQGNSFLGRTHMWYNGTAPVPFGFGLHYTDFTISIASDASWATGLSLPLSIEDIAGLFGSKSWVETLALPILTLSLEVTNTGTTSSDFVTLLFLTSDAGPTPRPSKILAAYQRIKSIQPGDTKAVDLAVTLDRLVRVDDKGNRILYPGSFQLFADIDAKAAFNFTLKGSPITIEEFPQPEE